MAPFFMVLLIMNQGFALGYKKSLGTYQNSSEDFLHEDLEGQELMMST
jgi:hypothetical protein